MTTARDIILGAVERTDENLQSLFSKEEAFIRFLSGRSKTVENEATLLSMSTATDPFPMVAMFTEGVTEWNEGALHVFRIPKIAIVIRTLPSATEVQRLETGFRTVLHPIFEEFARQLEAVNHGYRLVIEHFDLPCMGNAVKSASLNQLCDAVIIRNLKMKVYDKKC